MYDVIILGGGPAGLTAALYSLRYGMKTLILEELYLGGQIVNTSEIENYPGFSEPISGEELIASLEKQVRAYNPDIVYEAVKEVNFGQTIKSIATSQKIYEGKTVIIAMGQNPKQLGVDREKELRGKGVSYCATCDGNFFRGKDVAVVGGGDTAITEAEFLSRICSDVYVIHRRSEFRAAKAEVEKLNKASNVHFILSSKVSALKGETLLEAVDVKQTEGTQITLPVSALFVAVGAVPNTALFKGGISLDPNGYIVTDEDMRTGISGVFAAGDIRRKSLRQVSTAAADGAIAAHWAMNEIGSF
ncbi:MAG: thioredoxin-disulfide reductase [Clostridiales bacterium]|jgi:thioredoxin reductase (NADPH)|nr:thioredoxin-disulfide reductase [Clostridiales bacterium]